MGTRRFLFRLDVSPFIGAGHLRRCLTLAQELRKDDVFLVLLCKSEGFDFQKEADGIVDEIVLLDSAITGDKDAYKVVRYCRQFKIDSAIIDHYYADESYQQVLYKSGVRWLQFDGFAQQPMLADWILAPSPAANIEIYSALRQRPETIFLLGPKYDMVRPDFNEWRGRAKFSRKVQKILLTFGGGDDRGATLFCLKALRHYWKDMEAVILLSSKNPRMNEIKNWVVQNGDLKIDMRTDEQEVARCMAGVDAAIIAGGTTTFEVAAMGLPSLTIQIAENQAQNARAWDVLGSSKFLGPLENIEELVLQHSVRLFINDTELRQNMSRIGKKIVDCGGSARVARILIDGKSG